MYVVKCIISHHLLILSVQHFLMISVKFSIMNEPIVIFVIFL